MKLFLSEALRARSRRLVPMVIVGGLLGIAVGLGIVWFTTDAPTAAEVATAQAQYDRNVQQCLANAQGSDESPPGFETPQEYCTDSMGPGLDGVLFRDLDDVLTGISTFVILMGVVVGASLGGADWTSNTMTTLLTWESRRARVFLTRALVVALCIAVISAFLQVVFGAIFWFVAATRGSTGFLPGGFWGDVAATISRVSAMAVALGLVAYVIAMIGRSTVSSLGVVFGYLVLVEGVIAGFRPSIQGNLIVRGASVIVSQQPIVDPSASGDGSFTGGPPILMGVQRAWVVVGAYVIVLGALSLVQYRRRDVT